MNMPSLTKEIQSSTNQFISVLPSTILSPLESNIHQITTATPLTRPAVAPSCSLFTPYSVTSVQTEILNTMVSPI